MDQIFYDQLYLLVLPDFVSFFLFAFILVGFLLVLP